MKKKVLSLALCLAMLAALTAPASAASTEAGNTVVTKTIEAQPDSGSSSDSDPDPYPVNVPSYEISIPATLSLDTGDSFEITASKMELDSRQELHVMVDYDRTFAPDGYFYLSNTENAALRIPCMISKGYARRRRIRAYLGTRTPAVLSFLALSVRRLCSGLWSASCRARPGPSFTPTR